MQDRRLHDNEKYRARMSSQILVPNTEAAIFARLLETKDVMSPAAAEYFLSIDFAGPDLDRMNLLSGRAREGNLTPEETAELDSYLDVGTLLSILQSRARRLLRRQRELPSQQ